MTKEEYVKAKSKSGHSIHESNGIWWESTRKGYCKTAVLFEPLDDPPFKPKFRESIIGFNHRTSNLSNPSGYWKPFILDQLGLEKWSLETLPSGNRKRRIKKGLKNNEVLRLDSIDEFKEDFSRILISTAIRNGHGNPPEFYDINKTQWWENIRRVANYTEFWCAFQEGKLAGYICLHVMGDRVVVDGVKSDTDMLPGCPMDAIIYHFLMNLKERGGIKEIWYGGKSNRPSLDKFKESYGFEVVEIPFKTKLFGGLIPYPTFLNRIIKRGDDEQ